MPTPQRDSDCGPAMLAADAAEILNQAGLRFSPHDKNRMCVYIQCQGRPVDRDSRRKTVRNA
jgi:hypothetical protein